MTIKEASIKLSKNADVLRSICRLSQKENIHYIKAVKINGRWVVDDNTKVALTKTEIKYYLFQMLKYKNNNYHAVSFREAGDIDALSDLLLYLSSIGLITFDINNEKVFILDRVKLTDSGFDFILSKEISNKKIIVNNINLFSFEPTIGMRIA